MDENLFGLRVNAVVPDRARRKLVRMTNPGLTAAVFIGPLEAAT